MRGGVELEYNYRNNRKFSVYNDPEEIINKFRF